MFSISEIPLKNISCVQRNQLKAITPCQFDQSLLRNVLVSADFLSCGILSAFTYRTFDANANFNQICAHIFFVANTSFCLCCILSIVSWTNCPPEKYSRSILSSKFQNELNIWKRFTCLSKQSYNISSSTAAKS